MAVHFDFIAMWSSLKDNGHSSYIYIYIRMVDGRKQVTT